jgi:hypothetical protein
MNENDLAACKTVVSRHYKIRLTSLQYLEDYSYSYKGKLKVPSHQIRLALKWDRRIGSHGYKTADGKQNFKTFLRFFNFKLSSPSGILLPLSALHAIRRFRMQFALKGI